MTDTDRTDALDALLKRYDPARQISPDAVNRVTRAVLTRIAAEPLPWWRRLPDWVPVSLIPTPVMIAMPRYAGTLVLGLALGIAFGLGSTQESRATASQQATTLDLYAYAQPLTPLGNR